MKSISVHDYKKILKSNKSKSSASKSNFTKVMSTLLIAKVKIHKEKDSIVLVSDVLPSSLNKIVNWNGIFWYKYASLWKKHVRESILEYSQKLIAQKEAWPVVVVCRKGKSLHMDYDNIVVKPIIDGFVKSGIIKDDTNEFFKCSPFIVHIRGDVNEFKIYLFDNKKSFFSFINHSF